MNRHQDSEVTSKQRRDERVQRYKMLRAKISAQTLKSKEEKMHEYTLTSPKNQSTKYKLTSKKVKKTKTKQKNKAKQKRDEKQLRPSKLPYYLECQDNKCHLPKLTKSVSSNSRQERKYKESLQISEEIESKYKNKYVAHRNNINSSNCVKCYGGMIVKTCLEMLLILHESWKDRMKIISTLVDQLCDDSTSNDEFALKMCKFLYAMGLQFTDTRPMVMQQMTVQIYRLCQCKPQQFCFFAPYFLQQISKTWPTRKAGVVLSANIISMCVPFDTDKTMLHEMFHTMFELANSKQSGIRSKAAEFIHVMIDSISLLEKSDATDTESKLLSELEATIRKLVNDSASDVRDNGYKILAKFNKIAPNKFNRTLQSMSNSKIKKFSSRHLLKDSNENEIKTENNESKWDYELWKEITDLNFNMKFSDIKTHPKDFEKRIREIFVNRQTKLQNKKDKNVFFQDLITAERIGIHNNLPLLSLLNDVFVRWKLGIDNNNNLFQVEHFMNKYDLDKRLPNKMSNIFCSAIKQFQYVFPMINIENNSEYLIDDKPMDFVNYINGFLQFIESQKHSKNIKQFDLAIIPRNNSNEKQTKLDSILKSVKSKKFKYVSTEFKDQHTFYECFNKLIKRTNFGQHVIFIIDRRKLFNKSVIKMYAIIMKSDIGKPYDNIHLYPQFHIAKSKQILFGNSLKRRIKHKKKSNNKHANALINGILSDIEGNVFTLFTQICNSDCIRIYCMINQFVMRFLPNIDINKLVLSKIFKQTNKIENDNGREFFIQQIDELKKGKTNVMSVIGENYQLEGNCNDDRLLRDKQFETIYQILTHQNPN